MAGQVQSVCECQALLSATLDERQQVLGAVAIRDGERVTAPANSVAPSLAEAPRFDVVWRCPFCGRNTLRTFDGGAIRAVVS